jgi:hypothetical protein
MNLPIETPIDKLMTAISILQASYLAADSLVDASVMWGPTWNMPSARIEHVIRILIELLPVVEAGEEAQKTSMAA